MAGRGGACEILVFCLCTCMGYVRTLYDRWVFHDGEAAGRSAHRQREDVGQTIAVERTTTTIIRWSTWQTHDMMIWQGVGGMARAIRGWSIRARCAV